MLVGQHNEGYKFEATICLNGIDPALICVEIYAESTPGFTMEKIPMNLIAINEDGNYYSSTLINTERPAGDYTVRITANPAIFNVPLECNLILWQR